MTLKAENLGKIAQLKARQEELRRPANELYKKLRPYRTTGYKSHGWVWFYRQLPNRAVDLTREVLTTKPATSTKEVTLRTLASHTSVAPGQKFKVALNFQIADGWHIYGSKKGEFYLPTTIEWELPKGTKLKDTQWPKPLLVNSGASVQPTYEGTITVLVTFIAPKNAKANLQLKLAAKVHWQVCRGIKCKPGAAKIETKVALDASAARQST